MCGLAAGYLELTGFSIFLSFFVFNLIFVWIYAEKYLSIDIM